MRRERAQGRQPLWVDVREDLDHVRPASEGRDTFHPTPDDQCADRELPHSPVAVGSLGMRQPAGDERGDDLFHQPQDRRRDQVSLREHVDDPRVRAEAVVHRAAGFDQATPGLARQPGPANGGCQPVEQQHQQLVLVAHVAVDRHRRAVELEREAPHRQRVDAFALDDPLRRLEDLIARQPGRAAAATRRPRRHAFSSAQSTAAADVASVVSGAGR